MRASRPRSDERQPRLVLAIGKETMKLLTVIFLCCCTAIGQRTLDEQFLDAVQNRDFAQVEALLKKGANINASEHTNGYFALQYAINWPDARLVKLLLDKGANVNLTDRLDRTA